MQVTLRRGRFYRRAVGGHYINESVDLRLILGYQKCGNFSTIVKNEVTVDVFGYDYHAPMGKVRLGASSLVYHISYGVGSALLVLR